MGSRKIGWAALMGALVLLMFSLVSGRIAYSATATAVLGARDAVVRLAAAPGRPSVGYFTLVGGAVPERLVAAGSSAAARVELHQSVMTSGVMRMEPVVGVDLPARGTVRFAPGGLHLMIFGLKPGSAATIPLTLRFASGTTLTVTARAEAMGGHVGH